MVILLCFVLSYNVRSFLQHHRPQMSRSFPILSCEYQPYTNFAEKQNLLKELVQERNRRKKDLMVAEIALSNMEREFKINSEVEERSEGGNWK